MSDGHVISFIESNMSHNNHRQIGTISERFILQGCSFGKAKRAFLLVNPAFYSTAPSKLPHIFAEQFSLFQPGSEISRQQALINIPDHDAC